MEYGSANGSAVGFDGVVNGGGDVDVDVAALDGAVVGVGRRGVLFLVMSAVVGVGRRGALLLTMSARSASDGGGTGFGLGGCWQPGDEEGSDGLRLESELPGDMI